MSHPKKPLTCHLAMAGLNFKHSSIDLCYRAINGSNFMSNAKKVEWKTIDDALNDPILAKQRLSLLNGEYPTQSIMVKDFKKERLDPVDNPCGDCELADKLGYKSYREKIKLFDDPNNWVHSNVCPETGVLKHPTRIEFRFSNVCNYACRHCNSEYSSLWSKKVRQNSEELSEYHTVAKLHKDRFVQLFGHEDQDDTENSTGANIDMTSLIPHLERVKDHKNSGVPDFMEIELTGGEPFFQKQTYEFLEAVKDYAPWIVLIITTNGSIAGKFKKYNLNELLKPFGKVVLKFSLDADEHFYNYFREGGNYQNVRNNIALLRNDLPKAEFEIVISTSNMQAARFKDIYREFKEITAPENFIMCEVINPSKISPTNLPTELKKRYLDEWKEYVSTLGEGEQQVANDLAEFPVRCLENENFDEVLWDEFCIYTDKLDRIANVSVFDYFPEWEEYWTTK
ncbi:twitch domain-containing radical SAM protein [bacterium]|nr:twitch domain-containing radical SAM protein [bacterium]